MTTIAVAAAGAALGVRHALETDHLAAIATLVDRDDRSSGLAGVSWGIGHSLPIVVLGLLLVGLGIRVPEVVTTAFEMFVGLVLVVLGVRVLWGLVRDGQVTSHDHGSGVHHHLTLGSLSVGLTHHHLDGDSFAVGVVHGFAGSGGLVVLLVSSAASVDAAVVFLAAFSLLSVLTMGGVATLWGRTLETTFSTYLEAVAGLLGIAVGAMLLVEQVVGVGLL